MLNPSIAYMEDLNPTHVGQLTSLLGKMPNDSVTLESWLHDQADMIAKLPKALTRDKGLLAGLTMALPFTPRGAQLCKTHKPLNPYLIRRIFIQLSAEVTTRAERLPEKPDLSTDLADFTKRLQSINSLWMSPEYYRAVFSVTPHEPRPDQVPGGCEACILATIGGNYAMLADLRASLVGRIKKRGPSPRLLKFVDAWIHWAECRDVIIEDSDTVGKEVRAVRRELQQARRARRNDTGGKGKGKGKGKASAPPRPSRTPSVALDIDDLDEQKKADARTEHDFEASIIDYYGARVSRVSTSRRQTLADGIHPAFQSSTNLASTLGRRRPPTNNYQYSESRYSRDEEGNHYTLNAEQSSRASEERARAYQSLVGIREEDDEESCTPRGRDEGDDQALLSRPHANQNQGGIRERDDQRSIPRGRDEGDEQALLPRPNGALVERERSPYRRSPYGGIRRASSRMTEWGDFC